MAGLRDDLRFGARLLLKSPGFTAVAILTLALAIGANTAIFSIVNGVLLRPLPFPEADRLFWVVRRQIASGRPGPVSVPQYAFFRSQEQPFSKLTAYPALNSGFNLSGDGLPERVSGARVTQPFFEVFGLPPVLGRSFLPEEDVPGGPRVAVLGHGLWQRRFGGRPEVLGRSITVNGEPYTVIGVAWTPRCSSWRRWRWWAWPWSPCGSQRGGPLGWIPWSLCARSSAVTTRPH